MRKAILASLVMIGSLIAVTEPLRAAVITYRCNDEGSLMTFRVDSTTHSVQVSSAGFPARHGTAQISGAAIVVTLTSPRVWSIQINRNTGAFADSDGDGGSCQLVK